MLVKSMFSHLLRAAVLIVLKCHNSLNVKLERSFLVYQLFYSFYGDDDYFDYCIFLPLVIYKKKSKKRNNIIYNMNNKRNPQPSDLSPIRLFFLNLLTLMKEQEEPGVIIHNVVFNINVLLCTIQMNVGTIIVFPD